MPDHRKFLRLVRLLGEPTPHVIGYLMMMWRRGYQSGNPHLGDDLDVEAAAEFLGAPGKFATAVHTAGFVDKLADGTYQIHDLWDHAPEWAKRRMAKKGNLPEGVTSYCGITPSKKPRTPKSGYTPGEPTFSTTDAGFANAGLDDGTVEVQKPLENGTSPAEVSPQPGLRGRAKTPPKGSEPPGEPTFRSPKSGEPPGAATFRSAKVKGERLKVRGKDNSAASGGASDPPPKPITHQPPNKPRDEMFLVLAEVTGSDPDTAGPYIGRIRKVLLGADPPYTVADVRAMTSPEFQRREMAWMSGEKLTLGAIEKYIGRLRNPSNPPAVKKPEKTYHEKVSELVREMSRPPDDRGDT